MFMQGNQQNPSISVIIPTYNEAQNLPHVLPHIPAIVSEVILVDGLSNDDTIAVAQQLLPNIRVIQQNGKGKGNALRTAFAACTGDIIVTLDADGSSDPKEIPRFVDALEWGYDFAKGSRFLTGANSHDISFIRQYGNKALCRLVNLLFATRFTDLCYGYNALWKHCLDYITIDCDGFEIETQIILAIHKANLKIVEVPSLEHRRVYGESKLHALGDGLRVLMTILRMWMIDVAPLLKLDQPATSMHPTTPLPGASVETHELHPLNLEDGIQQTSLNPAAALADVDVESVALRLTVGDQPAPSLTAPERTVAPFGESCRMVTSWYPGSGASLDVDAEGAK